MATHELTSNVSPGPVTGNSMVFGAVEGASDTAPDVFKMSLILDYVISATNELYPTKTQLASVSDVASSALNVGTEVWQGESRSTTGFAEAIDATGLVTLAQAQQIADDSTLDVLTGRGDLITYNGTTSDRLPIGAEDSILYSDGTDPTWVDSNTAIGVGTKVQAYDATLQALSALGTVADRIVYTTGADAWAESPITAFGRSLIDDADAAAVRATLGVTIGTNVQAYDAELSALAGLTSAADKVPYFTGSGTAAVADFTSAGRSMVAAASAAAQTALLSAMVGDAGSGGTKGLVPAPASGDASKFLRGDGTYVSIPGGGGYSTYVTNRTPANLKHWTNKLNRLMLFNERPRINLYGDSITQGSGGVLQKFSPGELLAQALIRGGIPAQANLFGLAFPNTAALTAFEPRLTFTGTWGSWTAAHGTSVYRCSSNAGTVTFAPGFAHDTIDLYWHRGGSFGAEGSMTLTIDGGATQFSTPTSGGNVASQTISQAGATGHQKTTITIAAAGAHTITITNGATDNIEIYGFEAFTAAKGEVLIRCFGSPSHTSTLLVTGPMRASAWAIPAELCVLCLGAGDWVSAIPIATFSANLATLNEDFRVNSISDILYWTPAPSSFASYSQATQQTYVDAMKVAAGTTIVVGDLWQRWVDRGGYASDTGYYSDALHPAAFGDLDIAQFLADVMLREGQ